MMEALRGLLADLVNAQDPTKSPRIAAFIAGTIAGIVWISHWTAVGPRDANLVLAFSAFFGLIGLAHVFGNDDPPKGVA